jgi:undecaprenyl-diphosphatase
MEIWQTIFLSILQGITEWLPVSSSGHLAIAHQIFGFQNLSFDVFLHFAGIFAILFIFKKELINIFKTKNFRYLFFILVAMIPAGLIGVLFSSQIESFFSSKFYLGIFFLFSGLLIYSTKFSKVRKEKLGFFDAVFVGLFQAIAILPGISRSGATISAGMFSGLKREEAVKFSFLLSVPVILGASILELDNLILQEINLWILTICFFVTFFVSIFTIKFLLRIVKTDKFYLFGIYNLLIGIFIIIWSFV